MEEKQLFHERYELVKLLGRGNFSEVWLANDVKTEIKVALKVYAPATGLDDHGLNVFAREFAIVANANHKNLLKPLYYDTFERKPYLVLPYCQNGSIQHKIGQFSEDEIWKLLRDVASGLSYLHNMTTPIIHQDIKPDNVMMSDQGDYMLTDFGVSSHCRSALRKSVSEAFAGAGTMAYMAPERFGKDKAPIMANDIYSLGATAYEMLTGDVPFGNEGGLIQKSGAEIPELPGNYTEDLRKVIRKCLDPEPWNRPTAEQLEQYATAGARSEHFRLADEKSFMQKYKWFVVGGAALVLLIAIIAGVSVSNHNAAQAEQERIALIEQQNDSIIEAVAQMEKDAMAQIAEGDKHDEGFETSYIAAFDLLSQAVTSTKELENGKTYANNDKLNSSLQSLTKKLQESHKYLMNKASFFKDDDQEIYEEFKQRADAIASRVDVSSKAEAAEQPAEQEEEPAE